MTQLGIERIGSYLPPVQLDTERLGERLGATPQFLREKLGFQVLRRRGDDEETSDLCQRAYEDLCRRQAIDPDRIECVAVVTQNPDGGGIPHVSALLHRNLALPGSTACFDISLGCSGYVHGLSILRGFMAENQLTTGLMFTADPYSKVIDPDDRDTMLLFGDAATCTLISTSPRYTMGRSTFLTNGRACRAIETAKPGGPLKMVGNQVFRFVAREVPPQILECLARNDLDFSQVDLFLVHQGSKFIVETLASSLGLPYDKMPFVAGPVGNSVSSSLPLPLAELIESDSPPQRILLCGFGVGLSCATTVLALNKPPTSSKT